jgi:hypothetical protein
MPGAFLVYRGRVIKEFIHVSAADRPDYVHLSTLPVSEEPVPVTQTAVMSF